MTVILTDSTADLSPQLVQQYGIEIIPLYVFLNNHTYADGVEIGLLELLNTIQKTGHLPKTSAPTVADFQHKFETADETIYIGLSSRLSATFQNATLARELLHNANVYLIDSLNLSTGIGLLAIKAAEMRNQGVPAAEIARQIGETVPKVQTSFILETLEFLYKGGRCTALQNVMGSLLQIHPVIGIRPDGTLGLKGKTRGARQKGLQYLLNDFCENLPQIDPLRVAITHTGCDADAQFLKDEIQKLSPSSDVLVTYAGSVIASHCGPNTIGILYILR